MTLCSKLIVRDKGKGKQGKVSKMFKCQVCGYATNDIMEMTYHEMFNCDLEIS